MLCFVSVFGYAQTPQPVGAMVFNGSTWQPLTFSSAGGASLGYTPPGFGVYYLGSDNLWHPCTTSCFGGGGGGGGGSTFVTWTRQGLAVLPTTSDPSPQIQEESVLNLSTPALLTGYTKVQVVAFTSGWYPSGLGGTGVQECFEECADDFCSVSQRYPSCIPNHYRGYLTVDPNTSDYLLTALNPLGYTDVFEASTISALSQMTTPTYSNVLNCGSNGTEVSNSLGTSVVIYDSAHSLWRDFYQCETSQSGGNDSFTTWLATGSALNSLTKAQTTPVCGFGSVVSGTNLADCNVNWAEYNGTSLILTAHTGPAGAEPTPYGYRLTDATGLGTALVADASPMVTARNSPEGMNSSTGQIANFFPVASISGTGTAMYYAMYTNGCTGQTTCSSPSCIGVLISPTAISSALTQASSDYAQPVAACAAISSQVNPPAFSSNNCATVNCVFSSTTLTMTVSSPASSVICYTTNGTNPAAATPGTCSAGSTYSTAVSISNGTNVRALGTKSANVNSNIVSETFVTAQDVANFSGTSGTALSSYTTAAGDTFAANAHSGQTTTMPTLNGSGAEFLSGGTATTYGDVLDTLTPSSANYTVGETFTYPSAVTNAVMALFARQSSSAVTSYTFQCNPSASTCNLYSAVAGTFTQLGANIGMHWAAGSTHTMTLTVNGTTITPALDGAVPAGFPVTNSAVTAAGSAGSRITSSITGTGFYVQ